MKKKLKDEIAHLKAKEAAEDKKHGKIDVKCEVCGIEIPADYQNLLCDDCYGLAEEENKRLEGLAEGERRNTQEVPESPPEAKSEPIQGITDPNYQTNPEKEDKEQWETNIVQFKKTGVILWHPTKNMYNFIKNYCLTKVQRHIQFPKYNWRPKIVDVGCGIGVGTNILSNEADFAWGIDKNANSIKFAEQCFTRVKNGIYYSAQVSFDKMDIMTDTREFMKFDVVVAIEIIEHIENATEFIKILINKFTKKKKDGSYITEDPTEFFISTPNRNNPRIQKDRPKNSYHVREWTSAEFYDMLSKFFQEVEFFNSDGEPVPTSEYRTTEFTPILAKCSLPK